MHGRVRLLMNNLSARIHDNGAAVSPHLDVVLFQVAQLFHSEGQRSSNHRQDPEGVFQTLLDTQIAADL